MTATEPETGRIGRDIIQRDSGAGFSPSTGAAAASETGNSIGQMLVSGKNRLGFALRNRLRWTPRPFEERAESKAGLFPVNPGSVDPGPDRTAHRLLEAYDLSHAATHAGKQRYLEILSYLEWLDAIYQAVPEAFNALNNPIEAVVTESSAISEPTETALTQNKNFDGLRWLDVGAKNWSYIDALQAFLVARCISALPSAQTEAPYRIDGVELDVNRRYADLHTRRQYAEAFTRHLPQARYHAGDILDWREPAHVITHFLPFVFEDPLLAWGLPASHFRPREILSHLTGLLRPGGLLIIVNQGEMESQEQARLLEHHRDSLEILWSGLLPASFIDYQYTRHGWLCRKIERDTIWIAAESR